MHQQPLRKLNTTRRQPSRVLPTFPTRCRRAFLGRAACCTNRIWDGADVGKRDCYRDTPGAGIFLQAVRPVKRKQALLRTRAGAITVAPLALLAQDQQCDHCRGVGMQGVDFAFVDVHGFTRSECDFIYGLARIRVADSERD